MVNNNYKSLIENIMHLDHDRYKTYFTQFLVIHIAIFAGIANEYVRSICLAQLILVIIGLALSRVWYLVQKKIASDIELVMLEINRYENREEFDDSIRISKTRSAMLGSASKEMQKIPKGMFYIYCLLGVYLIVEYFMESDILLLIDI